MISLLETLISNIVCWIETAAVDFTNLLIVGIGTTLSALFGLLPDMPSLPAVPTQITQGIEWAQYWFPLDYFFSTLLPLFLVLAVAWWVIAIPLRWVKGIRGNQ